MFASFFAGVLRLWATSFVLLQLLHCVVGLDPPQARSRQIEREREISDEVKEIWGQFPPGKVMRERLTKGWGPVATQVRHQWCDHMRPDDRLDNLNTSQTTSLELFFGKEEGRTTCKRTDAHLATIRRQMDWSLYQIGFAHFGNGPWKKSTWDWDTVKVAGWDVSGVTNMDKTFRYSTFNSTIENWDVSSVNTMKSTFEGSRFTGNIGPWDVSRVTNMDRMFLCSIFNSSIETWDVSRVTNMEKMFADARFNQNIHQWNVSRVKNMEDIFSGNPNSEALTKQTVLWDTKSLPKPNRYFEQPCPDGNKENESERRVGSLKTRCPRWVEQHCGGTDCETACYDPVKGKVHPYGCPAENEAVED